MLFFSTWEMHIYGWLSVTGNVSNCDVQLTSAGHVKSHELFKYSLFQSRNQSSIHVACKASFSVHQWERYTKWSLKPMPNASCVNLEKPLAKMDWLNSHLFSVLFGYDWGWEGSEVKRSVEDGVITVSCVNKTVVNSSLIPQLSDCSFFAFTFLFYRFRLVRCLSI